MTGKSGARLTSTEAREEFLARAGELWDVFDAWYKANPEATFDEMEAQLGHQRREVLGRLLELRLREDNLGARPEAPRCQRCGEPMVFKGYPTKTVQGLEVDVKIARAYYKCPTCKVGVFPPGPTAATEKGELQ
jgi:hypothetical protein